MPICGALLRGAALLNGFRGILAYRGFILGSVRREFELRYRNSLLGAAWAVLNPLAMILVYTLVFSQIMKARLPEVSSVFAYSIYLCGGIFAWNLFSEIVNRGQNIFIENANLLKKLSFPRLCLPIVVVLNALLNFAIIFGLFVVFLAMSGNLHGWMIIFLVPVLIIEVLFAIGLGITLGVLNVFFRDVGQFFGIALQFWFWLTPIVYPASILPSFLRALMELNPMFGLISAFQVVLVEGRQPHWPGLVLPTVLAVVLCAFGLWLFRRHAGEMVDEL